MIRRGNSNRGEGATNDSRQASRRKSIRGTGGVSTAVFAAAVLPTATFCNLVHSERRVTTDSPSTFGGPCCAVSSDEEEH
ncbi:hypothetical protein ALC53_03433 [Atta colombica]|uniref:Uncharacterized protein n=1 Tax=Atta colombica TaxID=520822 RepID=A0A195BNC2_9HYME|nr:hypothetical protein ALC53_03433 [Atta colombica]